MRYRPGYNRTDPGCPSRDPSLTRGQAPQNLPIPDGAQARPGASPGAHGRRAPLHLELGTGAVEGPLRGHRQVDLAPATLRRVDRAQARARDGLAPGSPGPGPPASPEGLA